MCDVQKSMDRLRELMEEAHGIARSLKESGPVDVRHEAANLVAGIRNVDDILQEITRELEMLDTGNQGAGK